MDNEDVPEEVIPYIPLVMTNDCLKDAADFPLPQGYTLRLFHPGDEVYWAAITQSAGEFDTQSEALAYFSEHFKQYYDQLDNRCLFLLDSMGTPIGTATGWFIDEDQIVGRLHWVAISRGCQGRGLCKPMVSAAMRLMVRLGHEKAMLTTQPGSWKVIKVYLELGWKPFDDGLAQFSEGWAIVKEHTGHIALSGF
jgi:RimJ/RimL family protein N-acetyltransferase